MSLSPDSKGQREEYSRDQGSTPGVGVLEYSVLTGEGRDWD